MKNKELFKIFEKQQISYRIVPILIIIICILVSPALVLADDPEARKIMEQVDARDDGDNQVSDMEMILIDKNSNQRVRRIRSFNKDNGKDELRLMFFLSPADVENTAFLTWDYDQADMDDDQWLYLPAVGKPKRIAASDKDASFMGSDFYYGDITDLELTLYDFKILKETKVGDYPAFLIESIPSTQKTIDDYGYTKSILYVRKDIYMVVRVVHFLKEQGKLKYLDVTQLDKIEGIWVATELQMWTVKGKMKQHHTIIKLSNVKFNQPLEENFFTVRQMQKGL